jgi:dipeptidyl aminopeptidase/acylaminoacyl peptidase
MSTLILKTAYDAAAEWTHPTRKPVTENPSAYGLAYEDVSLATEDGLHLAAWYVPSRGGPALVVLHGIHGNRANDLEFVGQLVQRGYSVLIPDLRAHGDSDGEVSTLGYREVRDVRAATDYLKGRPDVDPERIGIYGPSMGAAVAIMAAAEIPELKVVVADSSFASVEWLVGNQFEKLEQVPGWIAPLVVTMGSLQMGVDARRIAPIEQVARISPRPLMIIHGEADETFLVQNATLLAEAAQEPKEVWIDPGVTHARLWASDPQAYVDRVAGFFDRTL